jgi:hypothetical protein
VKYDNFGGALHPSDPVLEAELDHRCTLAHFPPLTLQVTGYRAIIYANTSWDPLTRVNMSQPVVFFGDAARHPWLETTFNLSNRGCGLDKVRQAGRTQQTRADSFYAILITLLRLHFFSAVLLVLHVHTRCFPPVLARAKEEFYSAVVQV